MGTKSARSTAFGARDWKTPKRARMAVAAQKIVCELPSETYRRDRDIFNIRLYENNPVITLYSFAGKYYSENATLALLPPEESVNNKAKAAIDTLAAQIFSTDQRARFRTVNGNYRQRRRARGMQDFADGIVQELELHALRKRAGLDSCILESGVGAIQFFRDGDRVGAERCLATEFSIDPTDGLTDGRNETLYRRRPVPRDNVHAMVEGTGEEAEKLHAAIDSVPSLQTGGAPADHIEVFEAWHTPRVKKLRKKHGYHVISIDHNDGAILVEKFDKAYAPVVFFSLEGKFTTAWGLSCMTQVRGLQIRINANRWRYERAQKLFHAGHLYVNRAAKVKKSLLTNEIGTVWEGNGDTPPQKLTFQAASPELYAQEEKDGALIFANLGINQAASMGESNRGLSASAAAMREETAKADQRNADRQQRWEKFHIDCVRVALDLVRDIVTHNDKGQKRTTSGGYRVASKGKRGLTVVDWKDVAMDEEDYVLDIKPASPVPTDPDGLIAFGERMVELGAWKPDELAGYMQDLDADSRVNRYEAQEREMEKTFESMLYDKAAAYAPDEFTNIGLALKIGPDFLSQGKEDGVPDKHIDRVRRYLKRCKALMPPPAPPPGPPAAAGPPPGAPAVPMAA
jgi:hypothetical protein